MESGCRRCRAAGADVGSGPGTLTGLFRTLNPTTLARPKVHHLAREPELAGLLLLRRAVAKGTGAGEAVCLQNKSQAILVVSLGLPCVTLHLYPSSSGGSQGVSCYSAP